MRTAGIREFRDNLSRYLRRLKPGETIAVTAHGRVVAELHCPGGAAAGTPSPRYARLVAAGVVRPALEIGDPLAHWPPARAVSLPPGTAAALIDEDRGV